MDGLGGSQRAPRAYSKDHQWIKHLPSIVLLPPPTVTAKPSTAFTANPTPSYHASNGPTYRAGSSQTRNGSSQFCGSSCCRTEHVKPLFSSETDGADDPRCWERPRHDSRALLSKASANILHTAAASPTKFRRTNVGATMLTLEVWWPLIV